MKTLFCLLLTSLSTLVYATPVTLNFQAVPLTAFAQATFQSMMQADFVMAPDVVALDKKITINVKNVDSEMLGPFITSILQREGIKVSLQGGIYFLDVVKPSQDAQAQPGDSRAMPDPAIDLVRMVDPHGHASVSPGDSDSKGLVTRDVKLQEPLEAHVYIPINRPAELLIEAVNASFGSKAAQSSGDRVVVSLPKAKMENALTLLRDIDFKPATVEVSASWVEVTRQKGFGLGISVAANILGQRLGASLGTVNSGSQLSLTGTNFSVVLDALDSDSRVKQVSNSRMLGDAGEKIMFTVGDSTPTISSTSTNTAGNPVQNVVYQPSGVITNVTANVLGSGKIRLIIDGEISSFQPTTSGVVGSPTLIKRELKTVLTSQDGEVVLIGGLNSDQSTKGVSNWAFLPFFTSKADSSAQTDLVLVLSARVVGRDAADANRDSIGGDRG